MVRYQNFKGKKLSTPTRGGSPGVDQTNEAGPSGHGEEKQEAGENDEIGGQRSDQQAIDNDNADKDSSDYFDEDEVDVRKLQTKSPCHLRLLSC